MRAVSLNQDDRGSIALYDIMNGRLSDVCVERTSEKKDQAISGKWILDVESHSVTKSEFVINRAQ